MLAADPNLLADTKSRTPVYKWYSYVEFHALSKLWNSKEEIYTYHNGVA